MLSDRKAIVDALQDQFCSSFRDPHNPDKREPDNQNPTEVLHDVNFSMDDIVKAIEKIDENSSCPDFSIPAIVLKKCKQVLCKPLFTKWKESLAQGVVPEFYKKTVGYLCAQER